MKLKMYGSVKPISQVMGQKMKYNNSVEGRGTVQMIKCRLREAKTRVQSHVKFVGN
jgi:hypothetical protein